MQCSGPHDMPGAVVVDAFLEQAEIDALVIQLDGQATCTMRAHEYRCFVDAPESIADRMRGTVDAALRMQSANVTRAVKQRRLPARVTFGHEAEHRDHPREGGPPPERGNARPLMSCPTRIHTPSLCTSGARVRWCYAAGSTQRKFRSRRAAWSLSRISNCCTQRVAA